MTRGILAYQIAPYDPPFLPHYSVVVLIQLPFGTPGINDAGVVSD